jgi:hypothetical protein
MKGRTRKAPAVAKTTFFNICDLRLKKIKSAKNSNSKTVKMIKRNGGGPLEKVKLNKSVAKETMQ